MEPPAQQKAQSGARISREGCGNSVTPARMNPKFGVKSETLNRGLWISLDVFISSTALGLHKNNS